MPTGADRAYLLILSMIIIYYYIIIRLLFGSSLCRYALVYRCRHLSFQHDGSKRPSATMMPAARGMLPLLLYYTPHLGALITARRKRGDYFTLYAGFHGRQLRGASHTARYQRKTRAGAIILPLRIRLCHVSSPNRPYRAAAFSFSLLHALPDVAVEGHAGAFPAWYC